jgi:predicted  nucleic acid-binding Zn-ribbon protein
MASKKKSRILSLFTILLALIIACCTVSVVSEQAYIYTSPTQGPPGIYIEVWGYGFSNYTTVTIYFDDKVVGTATTNEYGYFSTLIQVPETTIGTHTITAKDAKGITASTTFTVTKPRIVLSQTSGPAGTEITISGVGLGPYQVYTLKFDEIVLETPLFTNEAGAVELTTRIPSSAIVGKHNLTLLYIGFYYEYYGVKYILYTPTTKIIAYAEFEVTSGAATTYDVEALRASLEDLKKTLSALSENVTKLVSDINALRENLTTCINMISYLSSTVSYLANELLRINSSVSVLNTTMLQLSSKIAVLESILKGLEEQLSTVRDGLKELNTTLSTINTTLSLRIVSEVKRLEEQIDSLDTRLKEASRSLEALKEELSSKILESRSELYNKIQEQSSNIESLRGEQATTKLISIVAVAVALIAIGLEVLGTRIFRLKKPLKPFAF